MKLGEKMAGGKRLGGKWRGDFGLGGKWLGGFRRGENVRGDFGGEISTVSRIKFMKIFCLLFAIITFFFQLGRGRRQLVSKRLGNEWYDDGG